MTEATKLRRNSFFSFLSVTSRIVANVIVFWVIARYYGTNIFGQFTFAHTLSTIFILFADFGFDVSLTTQIARNKNKAVETFQKSLSLKIVFAVLALVGMWIFTFVENVRGQAGMLIIMFSLYMFFASLTNFLFALYKGHESFEFETKVAIITNISLLILTVILIFIQAGVLFISCAFVITRIIGLIIGINYSKIVLPKITYKPSFKDVRETLKKTWAFGTLLLFVNLYFQIDTILLGILKNDFEVGIYQAAFKLIMLPMLIPQVLVNALIPLLSRLNVENLESWEKGGLLFHKALFFIVLPFSIILFIFPEQLIFFIYGKDSFIQSIPILKVYAIILALRFISEPFGVMLTTSYRQKIQMYIVILATIIDVVLNIFVIPIYGAYGASLVALGSTFFVCISYILVNAPFSLKWIFNIKSVFLLLISLVVTYFFSIHNVFNVAVTILIIISVFALMAFVYFSRDEKKYLFSKELGLLKQ